MSDILVLDAEVTALAFEVYEDYTGKQLTIGPSVNGTASQADIDAYVSWRASSSDYLCY